MKVVKSLSIQNHTPNCTYKCFQEEKPRTQSVQVSRTAFILVYCAVPLIARMTRRKKLSKAVTIAGLAAVGAIVTIMVLLQVEVAKNNDFKRSIDDIALDAIALTREYQSEEGKWVNKQIDNTTMVSVIDRYDPRYQELVERAWNLDTPGKYKTAREYLVKAIETEKQSNAHLRSYIENGSAEEYRKAVDLVSLSLQYSADYDAAMKAAG